MRAPPRQRAGGRGTPNSRNGRDLASGLTPAAGCTSEPCFVLGLVKAAAAMSEYQYYEFQAIDRPLSATDREALRDLSTRARITATSFTNTYDWGDFKGDPAELM